MTGPWRLRVDPVACDGIGICAHLAPDVVSLDRWGYPLLDDRALSSRTRRGAVAAIRACPRRALWLDGDAVTPAGPPASPPAARSRRAAQ